MIDAGGYVLRRNMIFTVEVRYQFVEFLIDRKLINTKTII